MLITSRNWSFEEWNLEENRMEPGQWEFHGGYAQLERIASDQDVIYEQTGSTELIYHGNDELIICAGDPIAQISFEYLDLPTEQPYTGKYQNQKYGPQEAIEETP